MDVAPPVFSGTPDAEVDITPELVGDLLTAQFPDLARLPLRYHASGWDNVLYRLGDEWMVRVPRRQMGADLIRREQTWLPLLAGRLPIAVPVPVRVGEPSERFRWYWSVVRWVSGVTAFETPLGPSDAEHLGRFLSALHVLAPDDAPRSASRGVPIRVTRDRVEDRLHRLRQATDAITPAVESAWQRAVEAPEATERRWMHGDLHPGNVLMRDGRLVSVIDWGDMNGGDIACDLGGLWVLLEGQDARFRALKSYGDVSTATLRRALGWAVNFGSMALEIGTAEQSPFGTSGRDTLRRIEEDAGLW